MPMATKAAHLRTVKQFISPAEDIQVLRTYLRQRENLVTAGNTCVQHTQKTLTQMNVQLANVISDISGVTDMAILRAIVAGERDTERLATYKHNRVRASREEIARSLEGNWRGVAVRTGTKSSALRPLRPEDCSMRSANRATSENHDLEVGARTSIRFHRSFRTKTAAAFQPQGPTLPHHRSRLDESRWSGGPCRRSFPRSC
jgi:hypothetical protein